MDRVDAYGLPDLRGPAFLGPSRRAAALLALPAVLAPEAAEAAPGTLHSTAGRSRIASIPAPYF